MENTMEKMHKATDAHYEALAHSYAMLEKYNNAKLEYENNKLVMGPLYWELYTKFRDAEAAFKVADEAEKAAYKVLAEIEAEYYANLKCTFCGELDSICGGDHSEEMRDLGGRRYD